MPKIVIIGAGVSGRLAKIVFPEAEVYEAKPKNAQYTLELGVQYSIIPIPCLTAKEYERRVLIEGKKPTVELIQAYRKKIQREGELMYGDFRQFEPVSKVYLHSFPNELDINFDKPVKRILLAEKTIIFDDKDDDREDLHYDYLISTIALRDLIRLTDLFEHFSENSSGFFMHRPIYLKVTPCETEAGMIRENYNTDMESPVYRENWINGKHNQESLFKLEGAIKIYPGKIYNNQNVTHILEDLMSYGVFGVGRYAQWDNRIHLWNSYNNLKTLKDVLV